MKGKRHDWANEWSNLEQLDQSCAGLSNAIHFDTNTTTVPFSFRKYSLKRKKPLIMTLK